MSDTVTVDFLLLVKRLIGIEALSRQLPRGEGGGMMTMGLEGGLVFQGDVTLTRNTALYSSRRNLQPRKIRILGCAKADQVERLNPYTQLM
jgi:hypothetical protein